MNSVFDLKSLSHTLGKGSAASFLSLVHSSRDELGRYASAIEDGLREGRKGLKRRDDQVSHRVAGWFSDVESALKEIRQKINSEDFEEFAKRLEGEAKKKPWFSIGSRMILRSFLSTVTQDGASRRKNGKLSER